MSKTGDYDKKANALAEEFVKNFEKYTDQASADILSAAPKMLEKA